MLRESPTNLLQALRLKEKKRKAILSILLEKMANVTTKSTNPTIQIHHEEVPKPPRSSDPLRSASPGGGGLHDQNFYLALPSSRRKGGSSGSPSISDRGPSFGDQGSVCATDEKALIQSLEVLAKIVGFKKSFSTNDILGIEDGFSQRNNCQYGALRILQRSQSDMHLLQMCDKLEFTSRLDPNSRSLSTWVAVGDTSATTQLPSPQVTWNIKYQSDDILLQLGQIGKYLP